MPGGSGSFAVAGDRATYGEPFNRVEELQVGDALVVLACLTRVFPAVEALMPFTEITVE